MVPFSHSRAIVSELKLPAMIIMITAINPGTMKFRDTMSGLYQTRASRADAHWRTFAPHACFWASLRKRAA